LSRFEIWWNEMLWTAILNAQKIKYERATLIGNYEHVQGVSKRALQI
jgi:hypothetical protein